MLRRVCHCPTRPMNTYWLNGVHGRTYTTPTLALARAAIATIQNVARLALRILVFLDDGIVRRHEALRTSFPAVDGQPAQVISLDQTLTLPVVDLQDLPEAKREAEALRLATEEATRPFDLVRGPLIRAGLQRLAQEEHVLLLTVHHIAFDGWSSGVFNTNSVPTRLSKSILVASRPLVQLVSVWSAVHASL